MNNVIDSLLSTKMLSIEFTKQLEQLKKYISDLEDFKRNANVKVNTDFVLEYKPRFSYQSGRWVQHRHFMQFTNEYTYAHAVKILRTKYGRCGSYREDFPIWERNDQNKQISFYQTKHIGPLVVELFNWTEMQVNSTADKRELEAYRDSLPKNSMILCNGVDNNCMYSENYKTACFLNEQDAIVFELKFG